MPDPPGNSRQSPTVEIAAPAKEGSLHHRWTSKGHQPRNCCGFQHSVKMWHITKLCR